MGALSSAARTRSSATTSATISPARSTWPPRSARTTTGPIRTTTNSKSSRRLRRRRNRDIGGKMGRRNGWRPKKILLVIGAGIALVAGAVPALAAGDTLVSIGSPAGPFSQNKQNEPALRSEEHTSELQSHSDLVCRLLLEKKKKSAKDR